MPILLVLILAMLAFALPGRGAAAPVIEPPATPVVACIAGSLAPECLAAAVETPATAFGLLHAGGLLLESVAVSAIEASESIAAVPLPAAGWLLAVGFGGLGLLARRRRNALPSLRRTGDGTEPAATTLRGSACIDAPAPRHGRLGRRDQGLRDRLRALMLSGEGLRAFAPGDASPSGPCGGAGHRYPPTAGRAPPVAANGRAAGEIPLAPRHAAGLHGWITSFTRSRGRITGPEARFLYTDVAFGPPANQPATTDADECVAHPISVWSLGRELRLCSSAGRGLPAAHRRTSTTSSLERDRAAPEKRRVAVPRSGVAVARRRAGAGGFGYALLSTG